MKITNKHEEMRIFSRKTARQLVVLKRYYNIDIITKVVTVPLHFEKTSDFVDTTICDKNHPMIKNDFLVNLSNIIHSIPKEFSVNFEVQIDNYEGYDHRILINSIKDAFEIFCYDFNLERNKNGVKVSILVVFGVTLLAWLFFICSHHWIGQRDEPFHDLIHEIIYTIGAVVFWEAIYIAFLPSSEYNSISFSLFSRLKCITLLDASKKTVISLNEAGMKKSQFIEKPIERHSRKLLLISGTALLCLAGYMLTSIVEILIQFNKNPSDNGVMLGIVIVSVIVSIIAGVGAVSFYIGKGPFRRYVPFLGFFLIIVNAVTIAYCAYESAVNGINYIPEIVVSCAVFLIGVIYIIAAAVLLKHFRPVVININDLKPENIDSRKASVKKNVRKK